jgi:hypothetical protein
MRIIRRFSLNTCNIEVLAVVVCGLEFLVKLVCKFVGRNYTVLVDGVLGGSSPTANNIIKPGIYEVTVHNLSRGIKSSAARSRAQAPQSSCLKQPDLL